MALIRIGRVPLTVTMQGMPARSEVPGGFGLTLGLARTVPEAEVGNGGTSGTARDPAVDRADVRDVEVGIALTDVVAACRPEDVDAARFRAGAASEVEGGGLVATDFPDVVERSELEEGCRRA